MGLGQSSKAALAEDTDEGESQKIRRPCGTSPLFFGVFYFCHPESSGDAQGALNKRTRSLQDLRLFICSRINV